jgi:hypothetical protein
VANRKLTALEICVDNNDGSVETSSKSETDPSRMSVLIETEETVEMMEGVLVKTTEVGPGDSDGVTTVVDGGTCNKGERAVGGRDRDDTDTIAVGVGEGDEEEEVRIDGDWLEGLSSIVFSRLA